MAGSFLQKSRHGTVFYFRRRIPDDLRSIIGKPSIVKSLGTEQRREAIILARALAAKTDTLFHDLRSMEDKDRIRTNFSLSWILDDSSQKRAVAEDVRPGEEVAAAVGVATLQAHFDGAPLPMPAPPTQLRPKGMLFPDALEYYLESAKESTSRWPTLEIFSSSAGRTLYFTFVVAIL